MSWIHQAHGGPATWFRGRPKIQRPDWLAALKALQGPADEKTGVRDAPGSPIEEGGATQHPAPHRLLPGEIDIGDEDYDVCWAGMKARGDSPGVAELLADGWTVEHVDPRYGTNLCKRKRTK